MSIFLDVPFVTQLAYGPNKEMNDPTGCWYASACMVAYFFEAGPRQGVPELHTGTFETPEEREAAVAYAGYSGHMATGSGQAADFLAYHGVTESEHELLAKREGLVAVPHCAENHDYTLDELEELLRKYGPVFFYWTKSSGGHSYGHASVLIGTDDGERNVIYHDPENAPTSRMKIADFNAKRQKWKYALMRRKGLAFARKKFGG
jgi:hypothetical protein